LLAAQTSAVRPAIPMSMSWSFSVTTNAGLRGQFPPILEESVPDCRRTRHNLRYLQAVLSVNLQPWRARLPVLPVILAADRFLLPR
jgi:hypothetical protein